MNRENFYKDVNIGKKSLDYRLNQDRAGNGTTFKYTTFKIGNVEYYAIEREGEGWKSGKEYEIQDQCGMIVQGFYNKVKNQNFWINTENIKNRKELIYKFTVYASNEDIEIKDTYYYETLN